MMDKNHAPWKGAHQIPIVIKNSENNVAVTLRADVMGDWHLGSEQGLLAILSREAAEKLRFENVTLETVFDEDGDEITLHKAEAFVSFHGHVTKGLVDVSGVWLNSMVFGNFMKTVPADENYNKYMTGRAEVLATKNLFISYSHQDKRFVRGLAKSLNEKGVSVWVDEGELLVGDSLITKLSEAIHDVDYVLAVISSASINSGWVQRELDIAMNHEIHGKKVKVLPAVRDDSEIPKFLIGKVWVDFRKPWKRSKSIEAIIRRIRES